jgi:hypothetical protein
MSPWRSARLLRLVLDQIDDLLLGYRTLHRRRVLAPAGLHGGLGRADRRFRDAVEHASPDLVADCLKRLGQRHESLRERH